MHFYCQLDLVLIGIFALDSYLFYFSFSDSMQSQIMIR
jgi:hypothetical protein